MHPAPLAAPVTTARVFLFHKRWLALRAAVGWALLAARLGVPFMLRGFVAFLAAHEAAKTAAAAAAAAAAAGSAAVAAAPPPAGPPRWQGWLWAVSLVGLSLLAIFLDAVAAWNAQAHSQTLRAQLGAAASAKALRLGGAELAARFGAGRLLNAYASDARRVGELCMVMEFLATAPVVTAVAYALIAIEIGPLAALVCLAIYVIMLPVVFWASAAIARLRAAAAAAGDERVRLLEEGVSNAAATKALGAERGVEARVARARARELAALRRIALLKALNCSLQFITTPIAALALFSISYYYGPKPAAAATGHAAHASHGHPRMDSAQVFYCLSLLALPEFYLLRMFVRAYQRLQEARGSRRRLDALLTCPEPPPPPAERGAAAAAAAAAAAIEAAAGGHGGNDGGGSSSGWSDAGRAGSGSDARPGSSAGSSGPLPAVPPAAAVELRGGTFVWPSRCTGADGDSAGGGAPKRPGAEGPGAEGAESSGKGACPAALSGVRLRLRPGELLGVCGATGAGKTSLLACLLGELSELDASSDGGGGDDDTRGDADISGDSGGRVVVRGRVAYCPQSPWIAFGTLRDNVTLGAPDEPRGGGAKARREAAARYNRAIEACALSNDLLTLAAGDLTPLGDGGSALSGGQAARIGLARCAFAHADVALLDDPLAAVDPRVAAQLFERCVARGGALGGAARVLVTHQVQFLPLCDRIAVMRGGRLAALGTWAELAPLGLPELAVADGAADEPAAAPLATAASFAAGPEHSRRLSGALSLDELAQLVPSLAEVLPCCTKEGEEEGGEQVAVAMATAASGGEVPTNAADAERFLGGGAARAGSLGPLGLPVQRVRSGSAAAGGLARWRSGAVAGNIGAACIQECDEEEDEDEEEEEVQDDAAESRHPNEPDDLERQHSSHMRSAPHSRPRADVGPGDRAGASGSLPSGRLSAFAEFAERPCSVDGDGGGDGDAAGAAGTGAAQAAAAAHAASPFANIVCQELGSDDGGGSGGHDVETGAPGAPLQAAPAAAPVAGARRAFWSFTRADAKPRRAQSLPTARAAEPECELPPHAADDCAAASAGLGAAPARRRASATDRGGSGRESRRSSATNRSMGGSRSGGSRSSFASGSFARARAWFSQIGGARPPAAAAAGRSWDAAPSFAKGDTSGATLSSSGGTADAKGAAEDTAGRLEPILSLPPPPAPPLAPSPSLRAAPSLALHAAPSLVARAASRALALIGLPLVAAAAAPRAERKARPARVKSMPFSARSVVGAANWCAARQGETGARRKGACGEGKARLLLCIGRQTPHPPSFIPLAPPFLPSSPPPTHRPGSRRRSSPPPTSARRRPSPPTACRGASTACCCCARGRRCCCSRSSRCSSARRCRSSPTCCWRGGACAFNAL